MHFFRTGKSKKEKSSKSSDVVTDVEQAPTAVENEEIPQPPPLLNEKDLELFSLVFSGKVDEVKKRILEDFNLANVSKKVDEHGYTICHIAVHRQDETMLKYLLTLPNTEVLYYDLLLHSIQQQNKTFIIHILKAIQVRFPQIRVPSHLKRWEYSEYSVDITPIILAAQVGSYELIQYFFLLGETFDASYSNYGRTMDPGQPFELSQHYSRLHEYEARSSPEMLCYRTMTENEFDPILEGMNLIVELKQAGNEEHEFRNQYKEIREKLKTFLTSFLDECRTTSDLKLLLGKNDGYLGSDDKYPRIMMALERGFDAFVVHGHCQKMLYIQWAGESWPEWRTTSTFCKIFYIFSRFLLAPLICLWLFFDFYSKPAEFFRAPINVCIHHFVSYVYFMIFLGVEAYFISLPQNANVHDTPCKWLEYVIIMFVMGHLVTLSRHFIVAPKSFLLSPWNWYDMLTSSLFVATFAFWLHIWIVQGTAPITSPRNHWVYYDSVLCGQATFSVALVLSYGGFMRFFQLHRGTGPMQIAMVGMIKDITVFIFFFGVIMLSFALSFYLLYSPFEGITSIVDGKAVAMKNQFTTYANALHSLYWALLGMSEQDYAGIIPFMKNTTDFPNHPEHHSHQPHTHHEPEYYEMFDVDINGNNFESESNGSDDDEIHNHLHVTENIGMAIWMAYHLLGTMILMNMLTGYMGNTFNKVSDNMISTWKFNRSQVWIYYIRNTVLPSPFNMIPSLGDLYGAYKWLVTSGVGTTKKLAKCSCCSQDNREHYYENSSVLVPYSALMKKLVQRYLRSKLQVNETDVATNEDVENILEQVGQLKNVLSGTLNPEDDDKGGRGKSGKLRGQSNSISNINGGGIEKFWHADERWYRQYETDPLFSLHWTVNPRPAPSPLRQYFTPAGSTSQIQASPSLSNKVNSNSNNISNHKQNVKRMKSDDKNRKSFTSMR